MWRAYFEKGKNFILLHKPLSFAAVFVLGLCVILAGAFLPGNKTAKKTVVKPVVHIQNVSRRPMYKTIDLFGQLKAKAEIDIVNMYAGIIDEINVDLGSKVQVGDILLMQRLDDARAEMLKTRARFAEATANAATYDTDYTANLARYQAEYKLAQVNYERYVKLYNQGAVSKAALDAVEQTLVTKKALLEELSLQQKYNDRPSQVYRQEQIAARREQEYIIAQNKYNDMIFKAPRSAVVIYRHAEVGGYAPAGTRLLTLLDDSGYTVDCDITEAETAAVKIGAPITLQIKAIGEE